METALERGRRYMGLLGTNEKGGGNSFKPVIITAHNDYTVMVSPNKVDASLPPETMAIHNLMLEKIVEKTDSVISKMPDAIIYECGITHESVFAAHLFSLPRTENGMVIWRQECLS